MGAGASKQRLGERVLVARRKLEQALKMQSERAASLEAGSPQTAEVIVESVRQSFKTRSAFLEPALLLAFHAEPVEVARIVLSACKKVLSAPIVAKDFAWFKQYVFASSVWFMRAQADEPFMYEQLMQIVRGMSAKITASMGSIFEHQQAHKRWPEVLAIENETHIARQDHEQVGLLQESGIRDVMDVKMDGDDASHELASFIDSNVAINMLTASAKKIDGEFQQRMRLVMSPFGEFKPGPIKKVERCQSKIENDYADEAFPKSAKLLDLVRCSVTFNTVDQLLAGYRGLRAHIESAGESVAVARVKNGFLEPEDVGYRDIKVRTQ